jgi:hypothetical protein
MLKEPTISGLLIGDTVGWSCRSDDSLETVPEWAGLPPYLFSTVWSFRPSRRLGAYVPHGERHCFDMPAL